MNFSDTYFLKEILSPPVNFCLKSLMRPISSPFPKVTNSNLGALIKHHTFDNLFNNVREKYVWEIALQH